MNFWPGFVSEMEKLSLVHSSMRDTSISAEARKKLIDILAAKRPERQARQVANEATRKATKKAAEAAMKSLTDMLGKITGAVKKVNKVKNVLTSKPVLASLAAILGAAGGYGLARATRKKEEAA